MFNASKRIKVLFLKVISAVLQGHTYFASEIYKILVESGQCRDGVVIFSRQVAAVGAVGGSVVVMGLSLK